LNADAWSFQIQLFPVDEDGHKDRPLRRLNHFQIVDLLGCLTSGWILLLGETPSEAVDVDREDPASAGLYDDAGDRYGQ
jgi:hypothetical protein